MNERYGVIYKITNLINNKVYIGQTTMPIRDRWRIHCSRTNTCRFRSDIEKYGKANFSIEEIDFGNSRAELNFKERYWIDKENSLWPNGYNVRRGGYDINYSEESRKKMSRNHADFSGEKNPRYGAKASIETRERISKALKGKYCGADSFFHRAVINLDTMERFETATEAAKRYHKKTSSIVSACRGYQKTAAGYRWAYEEVVLNE